MRLWCTDGYRCIEFEESTGNLKCVGEDGTKDDGVRPGWTR